MATAKANMDLIYYQLYRLQRLTPKPSSLVKPLHALQSPYISLESNIAFLFFLIQNCADIQIEVSYWVDNFPCHLLG